MAHATRPGLDVLVNRLPAAQIEIANAKVGVMGERQSLYESRKKALFDVVEDARHDSSC